LIAQLKGIPTKNHNKCATVFVNLYTAYVYLSAPFNRQQPAAEEETRPKKLLKGMPSRVIMFPPSIIMYTDNDRCAEIQLIKTMSVKVSLTHCRVKYSFQRMVKLRKGLWIFTRFSQFHAHQCWPSVIDHHLWPLYALNNDVFKPC